MAWCKKTAFRRLLWKTEVSFCFLSLVFFFSFAFYFFLLAESSPPLRDRFWNQNISFLTSLASATRKVIYIFLWREASETMDICANVQYNKVLEAAPLELLEVGCRVLGSRRGVLESRPRDFESRPRSFRKSAVAEKWKQISNSRHFQFAIVDGYNQFQFASNRFNSKSRTNLIQIRNSEQI